jgi:hypothetical protein
MAELVFGTALGLIAAGMIGLYLMGRALRRQVDALRAEVAVARVEGVLDRARPPREAGTAPGGNDTPPGPRFSRLFSLR